VILGFSRHRFAIRSSCREMGQIAIAMEIEGKKKEGLDEFS
jgi:hypothetical protein